MKADKGRTLEHSRHTWNAHFVCISRIWRSDTLPNIPWMPRWGQSPAIGSDGHLARASHFTTSRSALYVFPRLFWCFTRFLQVATLQYSHEFSVSLPSGSLETPLNGLPSSFTSMNSPLRSLRFRKSPSSRLNCVRPITTPFRCPLPVLFHELGLFSVIQAP